MSDLGDYLKKLRGSLSLREAANRSGLSHSYINYLEIGNHPKTKVPIKPSPDMLRSLAKAYKTPYKDLMLAAGYDYEEGGEETELDRDKQYLLDLIIGIEDPIKRKAAITVLEGLAGKK